MAIQPPSNGLVTENAKQYFQGSQGFRAAAAGDGQTFPTDFDTDLILGSSTSWNPTDVNYSLNNFKVYTSPTGIAGSWSEWITQLEVTNGKTITLTAAPVANAYVVVQLKILDGGKYGNTEADKAYGQTVEDNYGSYQYVTLNNVVSNFLVGYVGQYKLLQDAKRSDIIFFTKRAMQEFSYDTLKSIKSAELTVPASLTLVLPQDMVNYVKMSFIDELGVKRPIYPANNLTISPYYTQAQDSAGIPTQDNFGNDLEGTSITQERWHTANDSFINGNFANDFTNDMWAYNWGELGGFIGGAYGQMYGMEAQYAQTNGWFNMNEREGKVSFSSNLVDRLIVLEYISDGLAYDLDSRIPKLAEEAVYAYVLHALISVRINQPEYVVKRLQKEKSAKLRNAKIRLSNIKLDEIVQVMRGKSKWIKN
mgnify:FL=1|tara:strand:+ start:1821 stop:3086 length:1266 start_codon:yes stop_codon:yes gene_type:complete